MRSEAVVHADVGGAVAEFVVFDVVDEEAGDFGAAAAEGLGCSKHRCSDFCVAMGHHLKEKER